MDIFCIVFAVYLLLINIISVVITIKDKNCAKKQKRRVPEKTLFLFSVLGGSITMYVTMRTIHHKTKHKRFMIGIPLIIILQTALIIIFMMFGVNLWQS